MLFCDQISNHCSIFNSNVMMPLFSGSDCELTYQLGSPTYSGSWSANDAIMATINDQFIEYTDVELVLTICQPTPDDVQSIMELHNGKYETESQSYIHNQYTISGSPGIHTIKLGVGLP